MNTDTYIMQVAIVKLIDMVQEQQETIKKLDQRLLELETAPYIVPIHDHGERCY